MARKSFITLALAACVFIAFTWQRKTLAQLRQQNETLLQAKEEAARLALENEELPKLRAASNGSQTDAASTDLLRLRNQVRQFRAQQLELDRLRGENERLASEINSGITAPQKLSELEGFVAKESWSNAGFDTPEAALQTFFWAAREGDLACVAGCLPAKDGQYLAALTQPGHEKERDEMLNDLRQMTQGTGLRIVEKVVQEEGFLTNGGPPVGGEPRVSLKVLLKIQAVAGGAVWPVMLQRYADGWKMKNL
jgi:hypothetical protein